MNEKDRKKMILESRKYGGISLRRQILRLHKNGAKFTISKAYIDDEVLDPNVSYTIIIIPEIKIAKQIIVTLSIFKRRSGPLMFYSFPENFLNKLEEESIAEKMALTFKDKFFIHQSSFVSSLNYYFEIYSDWARGNKEMLLFSVILDRKINKVNEFESQLNSDKEMFKAFYLNELDSLKGEELDNINRMYAKLKASIKEFQKKISELLQEKTEKDIGNSN